MFISQSKPYLWRGTIVMNILLVGDQVHSLLYDHSLTIVWPLVISSHTARQPIWTGYLNAALLLLDKRVKICSLYGTKLKHFCMRFCAQFASHTCNKQGTRLKFTHKHEFTHGRRLVLFLHLFAKASAFKCNPLLLLFPKVILTTAKHTSGVIVKPGICEIHTTVL